MCVQRVEKIRRRLRAPKGSRDCPPPDDLKQGGVYALPDGTELVAGVGRAGRYFLYHPLVWAGKAWIVSMPIAYEIDAEGRVLTHTGRPTGWRSADLIDTQRVAGRAS
jgi:hypothetical protein